ncbi:hypothetical protein RDABS01_012035 [Bienertia sinuspersici]
MFQFQSGELSFQISSDLDIDTLYTNPFTTNTPPTPTPTPTPNQLLQPHINDSSNLTKIPKTKKRRSKTTSHNANIINDDDNNNNDNNNEISGNGVDKKKITHREIERQRRQEMSNLHHSLRSLLPVEHIRGKRSICDHVTEATKYIKELEMSVKELGEKRDKLKDSISSLSEQQQQQQQQQQPVVVTRDRDFGCSSSSSTTSSSTTSEYNVSIHKFSRTLQIEIIAAKSGDGDEDQPYPLSKSLKILANEGLDVVSCVSSKVNQRWMYVIYCEVNDETFIDSSDLQEKLKSVVYSCDT